MLPLASASEDGTVQISDLTDPSVEDFSGIFATAAMSLGRQTNDLFWTTFNPGWETDHGIPLGAERLRWRYNASANSVNESGERNVIYVVATVARPGSDNPEYPTQRRDIIGAARYLQLSLNPKYGIVPSLNEEAARTALNVEACAPGDSARQEYLTKLYLGSSLERVELLKEAMDAHEKGHIHGPPAVLVLDLCAVMPTWQGKGVGKALVQWGIQEALRRGNLESITQASVTGRKVYARCGYRDVKESVIDMGNGKVVRPGTMVMKTLKGE